MKSALAALVVLAFAAWAWRDSLRARERAIHTCRRACESHGLQLLDDTVALTHLRPARDGSGRMQVRRVYGFEVSANGTSRLGGSITLTGQRVDSIFLPDPASQTGAT